MKFVIEDLLTPQGIIDLSDRILLLKQLKSGEKQRDVSQALGISVTTVNRGFRVIKFGTGEIEKIL